MGTPITLGGRDFFRGVLKSCCNLVAAHKDIARSVILDSAFGNVRNFVLNGDGDLEDFARWMVLETPDSIPELGTADHSIILTSRGMSVEGMVTFFGGVSFSVRLCQSYNGPAVRCGYIVDPYRESNPAERRVIGREVQAFESSLPYFSEQSAVNNASVQNAWRASLDRILGKYVRRENEFTIEHAADALMQSDFRLAAMPRSKVIDLARKAFEDRRQRYEQTGNSEGMTFWGLRDGE